LVTKNPCLYPGDIRKLEAVNIPALMHCMRDCIVFPTTGPRPHSDEISGSDLDGDQYWVYWGNELKIAKPVEPLAHSSAKKLTVSVITNEMMIDYFLDAIDSNCYSLIADVHTVVADQKKEGTHSEECVELATLFYRAIHSPKTGETINMDMVVKLRKEFCIRYPKFMMKFDQPNYQSTSVLENLYLNARKIEIIRKDDYEKHQTTFVLQSKVPSSTTSALHVGLEHIQPSLSLQRLLSVVNGIFRTI
jgi:RNA-dependent RNA polymerase